MRTLNIKTKGLWKDEILLEAIGKYREVSTPKSTLRLEALRAAAAEPDGAWVKPAMEKIRSLRPEGVEDNSFSQYQIPLSDSDELVFQKVAQEVKDALSLERAQSALIVRLALARQLLFLEREAAERIPREAEALTKGKASLDVFCFWRLYMEMTRIDPRSMDALRRACRRLLDEDEELYTRLRGDATRQLRSMTDAYGPDKLALHAGTAYGTATAPFLAKALAGLFGFLSEASSVTLEKTVEIFGQIVEAK